MKARTLMVMGTSSSAGKSLLCTALCRIYARRGLSVLPFKAQNMSNNAAVCAGGEIGRAQAEQARACGVEPSTIMNPILLKPEADQRSQCVALGRAIGSFTAREYYAEKEHLWPLVTGALDELRSRADLVVIEGAGSPAELNLMDDDIVNLAVARRAQAVALLVGDIDRGGVFAQLLGTLMLLAGEDRALFKGMVVNKFRGDLDLFHPGVRLLEERSGVKVLGVLPYLDVNGISAEDSQSVAERAAASAAPDGEHRLDVAVLRLPRISNFDDFDALHYEPQVRLRYAADVRSLGNPQVIILPGSKSTCADLAWLQRTGLADAVLRLARNGTQIAGICGGFQMLGEWIDDPEGVETGAARTPGLGLLPVRTTFCREKATYRAQGRVLAGGGVWGVLAGENLEGYEIHAGETPSPAPLMALTRLEEPERPIPDGAATADGRIFGTYLHGLFENDVFRRAWLAQAGFEAHPVPFSAARAAALERLADAVEAALDMPYLNGLLGL